MITHYDKIIDVCINHLQKFDSSYLSSSFSKVLSNLSRKFKISQSSYTFVELIIRNLATSSSSLPANSSKKPSAYHISPLMQIKTKWTGIKPPSTLFNTDVSKKINSKKPSAYHILPSKQKKTKWTGTLFNTDASNKINSNIAVIRKLDQNSIILPTSKSTTSDTLSSVLTTSSPKTTLDTCISTKSSVLKQTSIVFPSSDVVFAQCEPSSTTNLSATSTLPIFSSCTSQPLVITTTLASAPNTTSSNTTTFTNSPQLSSSSNHFFPQSVNTPEAELFFTPTSSPWTLTKQTPRPQRQQKRPLNISPADQTPSKIMNLQTETSFLSSVLPLSSRSTVFSKIKTSTTHWSLPVLTQNIVIIGDSNIARLKQLPNNFQTISFCGSNVDHIRTILSQHKPSPTQPEHIILSIGINNRNQNPNSSSIPSTKALISKFKSTFPKSTIHFATINFSCNLSKKEKDNLSSLNKFLTSVKNCSIIPPLPKSDFATTADNIHWSSCTANNFLKHWTNYLKV
jgi:hypothetical protein